MTPHYRHTQIGWVILGSLALPLLVVVPLAFSAAPPHVTLLVAVPLALAGFAFSTLTVEVDAREIRVHFTLALVRRRVALADLRGQRAVSNPWRYGWGIHMIPGGWIWNVSGFGAVELELADGRLLRIGTDEPEALSRAIAAVAPTGPTTGAGIRARRGPAFALKLAAAITLGVLALATPFYLQARPPEVSLTPQELSIRSLFYGDDYPLAEIRAVSLDDRLPRILIRTNGFAAAGRLRGWFRLEGLGEGELFVDLDTPPFVVVGLRSGFVIVNFREPERTRRLHAELERRLRP